MNIQKVREALGRAGMLLAGHQIYHTDYIEEAIAELDDPADDDVIECANWIRQAVGFGATAKQVAEKIQSFAESYHAQRCAKCKDFCLRAREKCEDREPPQ